MKYLVFLFLGFGLIACSNESEPDICACIQAGEKLSKISEVTLKKAENGETTTEDEANMKKLRAEKDKVCEPFKEMGGPEMLERKKECQNK